MRAAEPGLMSPSYAAGRNGSGGRRDLARPLLRQVRATYRQRTARWRALPDFVIIGAMKAGTTSLYNYLSTHPAVMPAARKEVHYFDVEYERGESWYRSMFPTRLALRHGPGVPRITGEASPYYLRHPLAAPRCAQLIPEAGLLVLLHDPAERAFSHWKHARRRGYETLDFPAALAAERRRERTGEQPAGIDAAQHLSYLSRGRYAEQIEAWLQHFPREQLHVCTSERLFSRPAETYADVLSFLGLDADHQPEFTVHNAGAVSGMDPAMKAELNGEFASDNARLAALLGWEPGWPG